MTEVVEALVRVAEADLVRRLLVDHGVWLRGRIEVLERIMLLPPDGYFGPGWAERREDYRVRLASYHDTLALVDGMLELHPDTKGTPHG